MENNIYQAPQADLSTESETTATYYVVSIRKFITLFISTLGIYGIYWFYKNWSLHKATTNSNVWPVMRGLFSIFFTHSLFRNVNETLQHKNISYKWDHSLIATTYVVSAIFSNISDQLSAKDIGTPMTDFAGFIFLGLMARALYKAQYAINTACDDPQGLTNNYFSPANIAWIILGIAIWGLIFTGMSSSL
ncbi:MAG: DUF4234 domain-containing protein [Gammaproteobacteria bacterium]|nr:DUF4234 domain-containing protein [Gammaproteobacteria bacterium]